MDPAKYIYIYIYKLADLTQGWPEGSIFNSYYNEVLERALLISLDCSTSPWSISYKCWMFTQEASSAIFECLLWLDLWWNCSILAILKEWIMGQLNWLDRNKLKNKNKVLKEQYLENLQKKEEDFKRKIHEEKDENERASRKDKNVRRRRSRRRRRMCWRGGERRIKRKKSKRKK